MKHIALLFLSNIHVKWDTKALIPVTYEGLHGKSYTCVQTNEPCILAMDEECRESGGLDDVFYFATKKVKDPLDYSENGEKKHVDRENSIFEERIISACPKLSGHIHRIDYDEEASTDEGIRQVGKMAHAIHQYQLENKGEEIHLYADMTGGFRYASMMLVSALQLLKFSGLRIEKIFYANFDKKRLEDVTDVYFMSTLVSGTDEFANFGSVRELVSYFRGRENSPELEKLLGGMSEFADAIRICRTGDIRKQVSRLAGRIRNFRETPQKTLQESLFLETLQIIEKEYGPLLQEPARETDIIRWCVKKDFLQQAMTLCTEWLPQVFVDHKICYTEDPAVINHCTEAGKEMYRTWQQDFIISFTGMPRPNKPVSPAETKEQTPAPLTKKTLVKQLRIALQNLAKGSSPAKEAQLFPGWEEEMKEILGRFVEQCRKCDHPLALNMQFGWLNKHIPLPVAVMKAFWELNKNATGFKTGFMTFFQHHAGCRKILKIAAGLPADQLCISLGLDFEEPEETPPVPESSSPEKPSSEEEKAPSASKSEEQREKDRLPNRLKTLEKLLGRGEMKSILSKEEAMKFLTAYHTIRWERNQINHATRINTIDTDYIRKQMLDLLDRIDEVGENP